MNPGLMIPANGWRPREYQQPLWDYLANGGKRASVVWHRRAGKDLFCINWIAYCSIFDEANPLPNQRKGTYWHVFPKYSQGRKIVWEGMTKKGDRFLKAFPEQLVEGYHQQEMRVSLRTGSTYQVVGADNPDSLVGANPVGVIFSEWSLIEDSVWHYIQPILAENGGWAIFIFTPRGENHAWKMHTQFAPACSDWFTQTLSVKDTVYSDDSGNLVHAVSKDLIDADRASGMPEAMIQQEYYCSFTTPLVGAYYADQMSQAEADGRITHVPYEPRIPVHTAWDLGVNDMTSIIFFQIFNREVRIIDYHEDSDKGLPEYVRVLQTRPYVYGDHYGPWDLDVREYSSGKTRRETARKLGVKFRIAPRVLLQDGIDAVRALLPRCWFDQRKAHPLVKALRAYRKDFEESRKVYQNKPVHDSSSHAADAMRYLATSLPSKSKQEARDGLSSGSTRGKWRML